VIDGLDRAASTARHQAAICRAQRHDQLADWLEAFGRTLQGMADAERKRIEDPVTEVDVTVVAVRCSRCGLDILVP
jgi:hypothetical protein